MNRHRIRRVTVALAVLVTAIAGVHPTVASANSFSYRWQLPAGFYGVGIGRTCTNGASSAGYEWFYEYPTSLNQNNPILPNPLSVDAACTLRDVRMEFYARAADKAYDAWAGDGAVALDFTAGTNIGLIPFPTTTTAGRLRGHLLSRSPIAEGRVTIDIFQVTGQPTTSTGVVVDAFSSSASKSNTYLTGSLWNGQYLAFVTDTATGAKATGFIVVNGDTTFDLDLDTACFGIDGCQFAGTVADAPGAFHPLPPTRIVDSRKGLGIATAVAPGDGRNSDPDPTTRFDSLVNHQFAVDGVAGVPARGIGAVLLNVTATGGQTGGSLKLFPKPPYTQVFDDQSSFGPTPASTQLFWRPGEDSPNLVIAKVGIGGMIRVANVSFGLVNVVVDVLGWYDESQPGQSGSRLTAVSPERFLDTRNGIGGARKSFGPNESRDLKVAGRSQIPTDATAVVGTVTGVAPNSQTFVTVWPAGTPRFETSVLNVEPAAIRPNLATVAPGTGGNWSIYNERGSHDLLVDVVGFYSSSKGGLVTPIAASPVIDTFNGVGGPPFGSGETRPVRVTGIAGVPANATAVFVNTTVLDGNAWSYLTLWPGGARPETSNLNWTAGDRRSNLALVPVGAGGTIQIFNAFGGVHVAAEVVAYVS